MSYWHIGDSIEFRRLPQSVRGEDQVAEERSHASSPPGFATHRQNRQGLALTLVTWTRLESFAIDAVGNETGR